MFRTIIGALALAVAAALPAIAGAPSVTLHLQQQVVNGGKEIRPGTVLRYTIVAANTGDSPVFALAPLGRVPGHTAFLSAVAAQNAAIEYTLDNKTWSARPMVPKTVDGVTHLVPAPAASYAAVRWRLRTPLPAHQSESFVYEVQVK